MSRVVAVALTCAALLASGANVVEGQASPRPAACHEDEPCFNWRTMGNGQRGVVTRGGRRLVVSARRFDRLLAAEMIDPRRTPFLTGDRP